MKTRKVALIIIILFTAIMLSGCVQMVVDIRIHEDMSADMDIKMGIAEEYYDIAGGMDGFDLGDIEAQGFTSSPYKEDGYRGVELQGKIKDVSKPNDALSNVTDAEFISFKEEKGKKIIEMNLPMEALTESFASEAGASIEEFAEYGTPDVRIVVTFPYDVIEHNATGISGRTLTWNLLEISDDAIYAVAETSESEDLGQAERIGNSFVRGIIIALIAIVIIVLTILVLTKIRKHQKM